MYVSLFNRLVFWGKSRKGEGEVLGSALSRVGSEVLWVACGSRHAAAVWICCQGAPYASGWLCLVNYYSGIPIQLLHAGKKQPQWLFGRRFNCVVCVVGGTLSVSVPKFETLDTIMSRHSINIATVLTKDFVVCLYNRLLVLVCAADPTQAFTAKAHC